MLLPRRWLRAATLLVVAVPGIASAQAQSCRVPQQLPMPRAETIRPDQVRRTAVTRYLLALSWSPEFCRTHGDDPASAYQCGPDARFGFILHGLWPDSDTEPAPQYCAPVRVLPRQVIRDSWCASPSAQLLQHEWTRHGRCASRDPASYFRTARALYATIRYPDMAALSAQRDLTVGTFRRAFAAANDGVNPSSIAVTTAPGGWLQDVRLCLGRGLRTQICPPAARGAGDGQRLRITPIR